MASSSSRVFKGCRSLFAASKSPTTPITTTTAASSSKKKTTIATPASKPSSPTSKKTTAASKPSPPPTAADKKKKKKTAAVASSSVVKEPPVKFTRPSGLLKLSPVSPALRNFLGVPESARTQAVKKIWDYIKLHNLQNPNNRREIVCDNELKKIFEGRETLGMLEVSKLLTPHFVKI